MANGENTMTVTVERDYARATFTWSDDLQDCDVVAVGFSDEEIDAMIASKAHEGADFPGCKVTVS